MFDATSPSDLTHDLTPFGSPEVRGGTPSDNDLQRAEGFGRAVLSGSEKGSRIVDIFQRSPIRIMFPGAGGGAVEEAVLGHPPIAGRKNCIRLRSGRKAQ